MHEHGLADHILARVLAHPNRPAGARPVAVTLVASELSGLTVESLQEALDHVCEHEGLPAIRVDLEYAPFLGECSECGVVAETDETLACADCGAAGVRLCTGDAVIIRTCQYA